MHKSAKKIIFIITLILLSIYITETILHLSSTHSLTEKVGPVQIFTNNGDTCLFFEFNTWKKRGGILASPQSVKISKRQGIMIIKDNLATLHYIKDHEGPTFGPNTSSIFFYGSHFYLIESPGSSRGKVLYRMNDASNPNFERLDDASVSSVLYSEKLDSPRPEFNGVSNHQQSGWSRAAFSYCTPYDSPIIYNNGELSFTDHKYIINNKDLKFIVE